MQKQNLSKGKFTVGISLGYGRSDRDFVLPGCIVEYKLSDDWKLLAEAEFFRIKYEESYYYFQYKNAEYHGYYGHLWDDLSFQLAVQRRISRQSYVGLSFSLEKIYVKEESPKQEDYRLPFIVDPVSDQVYYYNYTIEDRLTVPTVGLFGTIDLLENAAIIPFVLTEYKLSFVGEKYGTTPLHIRHIFSISLGVKYRF
ncbi:MAG: hypothetical protein Q8933_08345 [Bacteroidota bacterium]|nr:hypothetical protein [Bacteroidota bacterium]MDP4195011.1 hypothetical protein [Bacteroidota bacterium]